MSLALALMVCAGACGALTALAVTAQTSAAVWLLIAAVVAAAVTGVLAGEAAWLLMTRERR